MKIHWIKLIKLSVTISMPIIIVSSCASSKENVFGKDIPTMKQIHDEKFNQLEGLNRRDVQREIQDGDQGLNEDVKNAYRQLSQQFAFLPNPVMAMIVYPHLTDADRPVPTYSTYFTFYEIDQIAILGEAGYQ